MNVQQILRQHDLRPRKGLGQHFLTSESHVRQIVEAAHLTRDDQVLEIGPGLGSLTHHLAEAAGHVVAVELDEQFVSILQSLLGGAQNVAIVHGDILKLSPSDLLSRYPGHAAHYKVVANLPYYITGAVLRHLLAAPPLPQLLVLTVQREVAERICAAPPHMSLLAVSVQFYANPEILSVIPAGAFYPRPKVDSAVVRLWPRPQPDSAADDVGRFFSLVRAGFGQRRKQLRNSLAAGLGLSPAEVEEALNRAGIDFRRRAETLTLAEWGELHRQLPRASSQPAQA
jgi:16S rRNA (adenine1518-N6/adenine1519-N6)-dimethyltransferase